MQARILTCSMSQWYFTNIMMHNRILELKYCPFLVGLSLSSRVSIKYRLYIKSEQIKEEGVWLVLMMTLGQHQSCFINPNQPVVIDQLAWLKAGAQADQ